MNLCEIYHMLARYHDITISRHLDIGHREREINALFSSPPSTAAAASASWPERRRLDRKKGEGG